MVRCSFIRKGVVRCYGVGYKGTDRCYAHTQGTRGGRLPKVEFEGSTTLRISLKLPKLQARALLRWQKERGKHTAHEALLDLLAELGGE